MFDLCVLYANKQKLETDKYHDAGILMPLPLLNHQYGVDIFNT